MVKAATVVQGRNTDDPRRSGCRHESLVSDPDGRLALRRRMGLGSGAQAHFAEQLQQALAPAASTWAAAAGVKKAFQHTRHGLRRLLAAPRAGCKPAPSNSGSSTVSTTACELKTGTKALNSRFAGKVGMQH